MAATIVPAIIAAAYLEARCDSDNVPADSAIRYCNDIYQELIDEKKLINQSFIIESNKLDTVVYTNKYDLPTDLEKMIQISVKYTEPSYDEWVTLTDYNIWDKIQESWLTYICSTDHTAWATFSWDATNRTQIYEWYRVCTPRSVNFDKIEDFNNISESNPIYFYENNNFYIFPRPKKIVSEWIILEYIPNTPTLTLATDDSIIKIESKLQDVWEAWVWMKFAKHIWKNDLKNELKVDYFEWIERCKTRWTDRHYNWTTSQLPTSLLRYMR